MLFKKLRIIFLSLLFFSLFISCENSISYDDEEIQSSITSEEVNTPAPVKYARINGFYQNYGGALPAGIQKAIAEINTARPDIKNRSAYPGLNSALNEIQYYVTATAENEAPVSGSVSIENKTFSVSGLKFGIDWTVEVGIKVKQTGEGETENWVRCFYDVSEPVRITESNMAVSRNLILKPDTSGYGSVNLDLTTDSNITGLEIKLDDTEQYAKWQTALAADEEKQISTSKIKLANLPSGQYDLTLLFKRSDESYPCYSTTQTIIVINGMTTDTWQNTGTSLISTTGEFNLTSTIISNYVDSCIYVGPNSASDSIGITPDNSNEGRAYSPLASVNEAIKRIRNANVRRDYKIFVSGEHAENIKIGGEGADVLPGTAAASITIQGLNNNNATDVLKSPDLSTAPCLSIQTDIPLIFKNIKITTSSNSYSGEYNTSAQGGGLYIKTGAVTLDSGALIDGCIISGTEVKGAGIYLDSGKLTIKTGAKISNNHFPNSNGFGGGIYIKSGAELILSGSFDIPYGGSVTQNDIYVEAADSIKIKNAISPQAGTSGAMATITPAQDLQRGVSIVSLATGSSLSSIAPYKDYFALSNDDWIIKANSAGNALVIDAPIYVAGSRRQVCTADGDEAGNGTKSAPFATIEQAINAIIALNATENYTIYVDGEIIGLQSIPSSLTSSHASDITIQGATGNTSDILNGNGASGTVLTISSPVSVTIKDLKITGGKNADGAGIKAEAEGAGAYLILDQGALITENNAGTASGGGVSIIGGTLIMRGNAEISECRGTWGGGIRAQDSDASARETMVILQGNASIKDCTGSEGGGIGLIGSRVFLYVRDNAEISGNSAISDGGGIRLWGSTANIRGGLIKENKADSAGGAISVKNGGVLNISGSVWIPEGVTDSNGILHKGVCRNDIYLEDSCKVTIAGALTPPAAANGQVAAITPGNKVRGLALIEADNTYVTNLTPYKDYFALTQAGWNLNLSADKKQITLDAPIYVSTSGSSAATTTGTKNDPFRTIQDAISTALTNTNVDYTILIDGELRATTVNNNGTINGYAQEIIDPGEPGSTIKAKSITIRGASDSNGNPTDVINGLSADGTKTARGLFIGTKIPVTIENLKITGGLADEGGGIYLSGEDTTLTLGNDVLITGNKAKYSGGGIYLNKNTINNSCPTLNIKGNVKICDNTNSVSGDPSNLYLPDGAKITVTGALTNGSKKAQIGISTEAEPDAASKVIFTSGYGVYNNGVAPGTYFTGDRWTVAAGSGTSAGEAVLAVSSGNITVNPIYEDIKISVDKTEIGISDTSKIINLIAKAKNSGGNEITVPVGSGAGKIFYSSVSLTYHGETVPSTGYYTLNENKNQITFLDNLPEGNYTINVTAVYNGNAYSAEFEVKIIATLSASGLSSALLLLDENTKDTPHTISVSVSSLQDLLTIKETLNASNRFVNLKLFISELDTISSLSSCTKLVGIIIPEGIKIIGQGAFSGCTNLSSVVLPNSLETLSYRDFNGCVSLRSLTLPEGLKTLNIQCLSETGLTSIHLPASVTSIAGDCFTSSMSLQSITVDPANPNYKDVSGVLYTKNGEHLIYYPVVATHRVILPDGLKKIGSYSFYRASDITSMSIPASVTSIDGNAFDCCSNLETISFGGTTEEWAAISKGRQWARAIMATQVICSNGTAEIPEDVRQP